MILSIVFPIQPLRQTLSPRTMIMANELNGLYAMDIRLCDQSKISVSFYFCYFIICVSVLWMFWTPSMYQVCMIHLFLLPVHVVFGRYFHLTLNLCLIYNLSQMYVNFFIANFEFRYVNLVKFIVYMCYTPYLVFMSAPYPSHESWHIKR